MGIFDRMGRVIQSNLNALLDKAEDDKKLVALDLDEMENHLKAGHQELVGAIAAEKQLRKKCDDLGVEVDRWDRRAELALRSGDEALAREALKQKKRASGELATAENACNEQRDAAAKMKQELERMREKLAQLKLRKGTLVARSSQARAGASAEQLGARSGSTAFDNFRRMEEKIEGREAQSAAIAEVEESLGSTRSDDLEAKFRKLERESGSASSSAVSSGGDVDDELAALKKRIRI